MKHGSVVLAPALLWVAVTAGGDVPPGPSPGAVDYATYCAPCHGTAGRGDGPLAASLLTRPTDLAALSAGNDGLYPAARVFQVIDGRRPAKAHGAMPAWADAFRDSRTADDQARAKDRIRRLVDFVASLQEESRAGAAAVCTFTNASLAGPCTESVGLPLGATPRGACEAVLACLNDAGCIQTWCGATTVRLGWTLDAARRAADRP